MTMMTRMKSLALATGFSVPVIFAATAAKAYVVFAPWALAGVIGGAVALGGLLAGPWGPGAYYGAPRYAYGPPAAYAYAPAPAYAPGPYAYGPPATYAYAPAPAYAPGPYAYAPGPYAGPAYAGPPPWGCHRTFVRVGPNLFRRVRVCG
jgi:hypothetical protein